MCAASQLRPEFPSDFVYLHVKVKDDIEANIADHFDPAIRFMRRCRDNGCRCLVHCIAGVSRSVALVLAFLVRVHDMRLDHAIEHVRHACDVLRCLAVPAPAPSHAATPRSFRWSPVARS